MSYKKAQTILTDKYKSRKRKNKKTTLKYNREWFLFFVFKVALKGAYLIYVTAAGAPLIK